MKRVAILILLVMSAAFAMAQTGRIDFRSQSQAQCVKSDMTSLKASFSFSSLEAEDYQSDRGTYSWISLPNTVIGGNEGDPQIPVVNELIAVPFGANPRIEVTSFSTTDYRLDDYGIHTLVPRQPSLRKDQNPDEVPFVYNAEAYQTSRGLATMPSASVYVDGIMRGVRVGKMTIEPVSYDPVNNTLRVFNDIQVEVFFDGADREATEEMLIKTYSPYFDIVYKQLFNGRAVLDVYTDHPDLYTTPVKMMVITTSTYANNSSFQDWVIWKKQKGIYTTVYTTSDTGTTSSAIKSFIRNKYNTDAPTFVVVVGDTGDVTYSLSSSTTSKVTDLYYSSTTDSDLYPEMFYSRMPVANTTQLAALIEKIMTYEKYTMADPTYLDETLLIAGWDSSWTSCVGKPTIQYANNYYFNTANGINAHVFLTTGSGQTTCYNYINNVGFANYTAHGDNTMWYDPQFTVSNVNSMTNTDKYFWAMGNCCLAANWGYSSTCFAEALLRASKKGAFGYIGSCPETYWYEDYYFGVGATSTMSQMPQMSATSTGCYDAMFDDTGFNTLNAVPFIGNLAVAYAHAGNYTTSTSEKYYWEAYHCLGDGSVMPFHKNPDPNQVSHAATFPAGATSFPVSAIAGSYVAITQNNEIIGVGVVPSSGTVNVPIDTPVTRGTVMIVVTRQQRQPYITTLEVASAASEYTITVTANPTNGGTVTGAGTFSTGSTRTVTATANTGFTFKNWTENGNVVSTNANYTFTLNYNRNLVANFEGQTFTITATANPAEGGSVALSRSRETLTYNFDNGWQGWTAIKGTSGNSPHNWMHNTEYTAYDSNGSQIVPECHNSSAGMMLSESYISATSAGAGNASAVTPDNWLVSPQITLGGSITFYAAARMSNYPAEKFTVYVSTTNNTSTSAFTATSLTVTLSDNTWHEYTVDLSAYSGQGYVAIRHYDCNDQHLLYIDDVTIVEGEYVNPGYASDTYTYGETCIATATPNNGYSFVNWTENGSVVSTNATYSFTVTADRNLVANFSTQQADNYNVNVSALPNAGGTVTGTGTYAQGASCTVVATPNQCYTFINWTENGTVVSTNPSYTFSVYSNRNLVANFQMQTYTVTATPNPLEGGSVAFGRGNRDEFTYNFENSSTQGWTFIKGTTGNSPNNWMHNTNYTPRDYSTGYGHSSSDGFMISESYISTEQQASGTAVTPDNYLVSPQVVLGGSIHFWASNPNDEYGAEHFGVFVSTTNNTSASAFTMVSEWTLLSKATPTGNTRTIIDGVWYEYSADLSAYNGQNGYVAIRHFNCNDQWLLCIDDITIVEGTTGGDEPGTVVTNSFDCGESCTLTATANEGYNFINWTENGTAVSTNATYTFTVSSDRNLVANFAEAQAQTYTVTVTPNPANGGSATGGGTFTEGQSCTVVATPNTNYNFVNWTENGTVVSTNASYTFTVNANRNLVANFNYIAPTYTVTVSANPTNGGTATGGGTFTEGQTCTVVASPNAGYNFINWTENGSVVSGSATYTFTVTSNRNLVANFAEQQIPTYNVNVSANPANGGDVTGTGTYSQGQSCTVVANANDCYAFVNWTENGAVVSANPSYTFTVNGNRTLVANFEMQTYTITATPAPVEGGTVAISSSRNELFFDFEDGTQGWTAIDADGDGYNWNHKVNTGGGGDHTTHSGDAVMFSESYSNDAGTALTPDNYLVSPQITLGGSITFYACAQDPDWANEHFGVAVSTTSNTDAAAFTTIQEWTLDSKSAVAFTGLTRNGGNRAGEYNEYTVDLSAYSGLGYVAIRHFNCTDMFIINVDDITIVEGNGGGGEIGETVTADFECGETVTLTATPNPNYEFVNWTEDGVEVSTSAVYTFTVNGNRNLVAHFAYDDAVNENALEIALYPNPVNDLLNVVASEAIDNLEVYSVTGALVYTKQGCSNKVEISTSTFAPGAYLIRMTTQSATEVRRFVKF